MEGYVSENHYSVFWKKRLMEREKWTMCANAAVVGGTKNELRNQVVVVEL
jgi:hypothetical protein